MTKPVLALGGLLPVVASFSLHAQVPICNLPSVADQQANPIHELVLDGAPNSFVKAVLSNVPNGYTLTNGAYAGWCVDYNNLIYDGWTYAPIVYFSYDPTLPAAFQNPNWDLVNYILNHKRGNDIDVQYAIWHFTSGPVPPGDPIYSIPSPDALALIADAQANGEGFLPGLGDVSAVIMDLGPDAQRHILEVACPISDPQRLASIGDRVWWDRNANGVQDLREPGFPGVEVKLLDCDGRELAATITDTNGLYHFENLLPGTYKLQFMKPEGFTFTSANVGTNDALDSDVFRRSGLTDCFGVIPGDRRIDVACGLKKALRFVTFTQHGWGAPPDGNNGGTVLTNIFANCFRQGIGVGYPHTAWFTGAPAIEKFLPAEGDLGVLTQDLRDPEITVAGEFAGHVLALRLNTILAVKSRLGIGFITLKVAPGHKFAGASVARLLILAEKVLGGNLAALPVGCTLADLNATLAHINANFVGGVDLGFLNR